ncbi:LysR family transcriptional regulator [Marivita sp. S6314]|uniref:LysR family transcriptional regulator n=1 Tax=Marivita sp. S6314 TaxID=2926406 RepID=UPI001FF1EFBF|nr:LysR family transcriptional regulator [Marivita sp. S6314]MCK0149538.1 LysR family transcriptional regulator [Marivita sp. S6314]
MTPLHRLDLNLLVTFEALMDEGSVAKAAERLNKTPSAVSHALARLREQVGDPLMVKVGGKMQPSPFAETLIEDVRPILRSIQRVVTPPEPFDPATSTRTFRIAVPAITALIAEVFARINQAAPGVSLEWVNLGPHLYDAVADEEIDLALLGADKPLPEGLMEQKMPTLERYTYMRRGHPAAENWNKQAWLDWPHVMVGMSNAARQTVEDRVARDGMERRIGAHLPEFSGVAPLLARTNMLGTSAQLFMVEDTRTYGLLAKRPPVDLPDITFRFFWSARLSQDPGGKWLRSLVIAAYETIHERAVAAGNETDE